MHTAAPEGSSGQAGAEEASKEQESEGEESEEGESGEGEGEGKGSQGEDDKAEEAGQEEAEDLELAWEAVELARVAYIEVSATRVQLACKLQVQGIYVDTLLMPLGCACPQDGADKHASELGDVHFNLADLSAENGKFAEALPDYATCLEYLGKMEPKDNRR